MKKIPYKVCSVIVDPLPSRLINVGIFPRASKEIWTGWTSDVTLVLKPSLLENYIRNDNL
jgi:hypothetical protein